MTPRKRLPARRRGIGVTIGTGADEVHMSTGEYPDGSLGEVFLVHQREGTFGRSVLNAFAMAVSLGLQHGITLETFQHTYRDFKMQPDLVRGIFDELEQHYGGRVRD